MAKNYDDNREVTFEIVEEIGILSSSSTGWTKELNLVSWNGSQAKYDIREWSPHHDRMSKGMTFNEQEMRMIVDLLKRRSRFVPRGVNTVNPGANQGRSYGAPAGADYAANSGSNYGAAVSPNNEATADPNYGANADTGTVAADDDFGSDIGQEVHDEVNADSDAA